MKFRFFVLAVCLLGLVSLVLPNPSQAASKAPADYKERSFNKGKLDDFKDDEEFIYAQPPRLDVELGFLERIFRGIGKALSAVPKWAWDSIPYVLMAVALILIIFYIRKVLFTGGVKRTGTTIIPGQFFEEDIHSIDFNKAINDAIAAKELRLATRLYFLMTLKLLHDRKLIRHSLEKTNRDYLYELKQSGLRDDFKWLARSFEFVWYGNTQPTAAAFEQVQTRYTQFIKQVEQPR